MPEMTLDYHADSITLSVVEAIAEERDADPVDLEPLYEVLDPEALDRLFTGSSDVRVQFEYADHAVEVRSDGTIVVDGTVHERP